MKRFNDLISKCKKLAGHDSIVIVKNVLIKEDLDTDLFISDGPQVNNKGYLTDGKNRNYCQFISHHGSKTVPITVQRIEVCFLSFDECPLRFKEDQSVQKRKQKTKSQPKSIYIRDSGRLWETGTGFHFTIKQGIQDNLIGQDECIFKGPRVNKKCVSLQRGDQYIMNLKCSYTVPFETKAVPFEKNYTERVR